MFLITWYHIVTETLCFWYVKVGIKIERFIRQRVLIRNYYSVSPKRLVRRFHNLKSLTLKGKPHFNDFTLVPRDWGGFVYPWIEALAKNKVGLEELRLKRIVVSDESLNLLSRSFVNLSLRLNHCSMPVDALPRILMQVPQLVDFGIGSFSHYLSSDDTYQMHKTAIVKCKSISSLSGFLDMPPFSLALMRNICCNLTSLNLSYEADIQGRELIQIINLCSKLQCLWITDCIGDKGLRVVARTCRDLQELRVFPSAPFGNQAAVTEKGLLFISKGCQKLHTLDYFCRQMTNAALMTMAKNCPNFIQFKLCIPNATKPDPDTMQPLDEGFRAIVQSCEQLKRLSLAGQLTDQVFLYIGIYAEQLEMLSIAFAGESDMGLLYVLNGCKKLRKLKIRNCPFGHTSILTNIGKYETMQSLWMSSCEVTIGACKTLAKKMPMLNVEIFNESEQADCYKEDDGPRVVKMYLYRTVAGKREDAPEYIRTL